MKYFNKSVFYFIVNVAILLIVLTKTLFAWSSGPPAYRTGAPGDEGTCSADGCHNSFPPDSGSAKFSISGPSAYTPGKAVKIGVSFSDSGGKLHGFEMTAVDADGNRVGKFKNIGSTTRVISPNDPARGLEKKDKGKYIEHTIKGSKKKSWKVKWTSPASASGTITFYAAGNEADGGGTNSGDYIYTTTLEIAAESSASGQ
ncbi:MAG: choice-of-anchor V domain-containing protein [Candidatus Brocadiaceae bacterium]|uniref:choice-of-anchor V domain-containing protein n=1 Tax=Candidatus Wunengus sp. YC61 TaxID=3367698 RepID=UPI00271DCA32|nr:choice-of-anchor V domain-containing protein [Candidatus Brocadiaceae bacterium]